MNRGRNWLPSCNPISARQALPCRTTIRRSTKYGGCCVMKFSGAIYQSFPAVGLPIQAPPAKSKGSASWDRLSVQMQSIDDRKSLEEWRILFSDGSSVGVQKYQSAEESTLEQRALFHSRDGLSRSTSSADLLLAIRNERLIIRLRFP